MMCFQTMIMNIYMTLTLMLILMLMKLLMKLAMWTEIILAYIKKLFF
eukprot:UN00118